ncbi:hypothetical protein [Xanthocytophaga agilis]|uniref:Uncharacterized protein n=1 Tax=Xanthocytophaga agilis TaxID=3048010 RepID=A0AAE3R7J5_9BACT|nr:hypothetical protein [Xanthocytophaga agilis]MDJ1504635.1 hypothetical protein [Xanthocytophaga agilis]
MKSTSAYYIILLVTSLFTFSCRDDDRIRIPQVEEGVNMRIIVDTDKSDFSSDDLSNSAIEFDAYSINQNLSTVQFIGDYIDASAEDTITGKLVLSLSQADFTNGKARGVITATQVATAFGLPNGIADMGEDDELILYPTVTLTDGRVFNIDNSAPSIGGGTNSSFTVIFGAVVK